MVKEKSIPLFIILSFFTCGLFNLFWIYSLTEDTNEVTEEEGPNGWMTLLFCVLSCHIYSCYWAYKQGEKLDRSREASGAATGNLAMLYLALSAGGYAFSVILSFMTGGFTLLLREVGFVIAYALMQDEINKHVAV